jgi:hypothetical protein
VTKPIDSSPSQELALALPWYVARALAQSEHLAVHREIGKGTQLRHQVRSWRAIDAAIREEVAEFRAPAFARIEQRLHRSTPWVQHWRRWTSRFCSPPAMALAWSLVAVQFGLLVVGGPQDQPHYLHDGHRTIGLVAPADSQLIRVSFRVDTRESELRDVLRRQRAHIVAGPTVLGHYFVSVPRSRSDQVLGALRLSQSVESADTGVTLPDERW